MSRVSTDFRVRRSDWKTFETVESALPERLADGQVLMRIDRFALTSNNITYAVTGDMLGYWNFFPAEDPWGRIPAMGFADVVESSHPEVAVGERIFGFFPMSTYLIVSAAKATPAHFFDAAEHRRGTALVYRQYLRCAADPQYEARREDHLALLRGLFFTSFLVDDFLADQHDFGARVFLVSSASSKTAIALSHQLAKRKAGTVIGLTSPANRGFVESLGSYDRVVAYDEVSSLDANAPAVFIDHAGNSALTAAIHGHWGDRLRYSGIIGATHWQSERTAAPLPGPTPSFFFAPTQFEKRQGEWGPAEFQNRLTEGWRGFADFSDRWMKVVHGYGRHAVEATYAAVVEGRSTPEQGHILSLWDKAA